MKSTWFLDKRRYEIAKQFMDGHHEHRSQQVFRDFVRMSSLSLLQKANQVAGGFSEKTENEVLELQKRYPKWQTTFRPAFGMLAQVYQENLASGQLEDFIGAMYEELGASNAWHGQFFTPMAICRLMAQITLGTKEQFEERFAADPRRVRINEPACGAGATMLAVWEQLMQWGVPASAVYFFGIDLDPMCVDMCYLQMTLSGAPATIYNANTLANPTCEGAPAYTTAMARMFPWKGNCGMHVTVANPPFGGKVAPEDLHYSLGGKAGLVEGKIPAPAMKPDSKPSMPLAPAVQTPGSKPTNRRLAIRDR